MPDNKFSINRSLSVGNLAAAFLAITYVFGYLIHRAFTTTLGLTAQGLFQAEYLEAGLFFEILSLAIVGIPVILWLLLRGLSGSPESSSQNSISENSPKTTSSGAARDMRLAFLLASNLLYVLIFFAIFMTMEYLESTLEIFGHRVSFGLIALGYIFAAIVFFLTLGLIRRALKEGCGATAITLLKGLRFVCLACLVAISVGIDAILIFAVPLLRRAVVSADLYIAFLVLLLCVVTYAYSRTRQLEDHRVKTLMIGVTSFYAFIITYFVLLTYGFSIYPNIPRNRGGRYPLTQMTFVIREQSRPNYRGLIDKAAPTNGTTFPLFVLNRENDLFFVTDVRGPFREWIGRVHVIKKDDCENMEIARNSFLRDISAEVR